jgi:hypothetical protein
VPAFAQQKDTVDPQIIEQLNALGKKFDEAWKNNDAAAPAVLYTEDAVRVTDTGPLYGREAIEKGYADLFSVSASVYDRDKHVLHHDIKRNARLQFGDLCGERAERFRLKLQYPGGGPDAVDPPERPLPLRDEVPLVVPVAAFVCAPP